jgi:hypothetical protein
MYVDSKGKKGSKASELEGAAAAARIADFLKVRSQTLSTLLWVCSYNITDLIFWVRPQELRFWKYPHFGILFGRFINFPLYRLGCQLQWRNICAYYEAALLVSLKPDRTETIEFHLDYISDMPCFSHDRRTSDSVLKILQATRPPPGASGASGTWQRRCRSRASARWIVMITVGSCWSRSSNGSLPIENL